jgi:hypothetical protein
MALRRPKVMRDLVRIPSRLALTGAVASVELGSESSWKTWKFGNRDWQVEAWRLYDIIPELKFLSNWIGDSVAQSRLYVTEVDDTGESTGEVEDAEISRLAAAPLGTGSQRDDNFRLAAVDLAIGGECWMIGEDAAGSDPGTWFVVTGAAFKKRGDQVSVRRPRILGGKELILRDGTDVMIRCWRPHPNDTDQADSPTRSAIPPLREIELLTKREFAELDSRLTGAGIMFLPEGIDFPRGDDDPGDMTGFMAYLQRVAAASMRDQSSASAMVPIMATVPDGMVEHLDKIQVINFWSELSDKITDLRNGAVARAASAFEIPSELLLGLSTANHWTAWAISEEGIKRIKAYLTLIADALTRGYLHPKLKGMGIDEKRYVYAFDTGPLAARPNRKEDAIELFDRGLISEEEMVKAAAFSPGQMPTAEERVKMLLLKALGETPGLFLDPAVQRVLGLPPIKRASVLEQRSLPSRSSDEPDDGDSEDGPPDDGSPDGLDDQASVITAALDSRIAELTATRVGQPPSPQNVFNAACKLIILRALERAGGRITTPVERRTWGNTPRHELHAKVGPVPPAKVERILAGAWDHVDVVAADLGVDPRDLQRLLCGYVTELLTRGIPHHDDLLYAALSIANRGAGLVPEVS